MQLRQHSVQDVALWLYWRVKVIKRFGVADVSRVHVEHSVFRKGFDARLVGDVLVLAVAVDLRGILAVEGAVFDATCG